MSFYTDASLVLIPSGIKDQKVYCAKPVDGSGDLTFTRSIDSATRVGSDGLIEKVRTNIALYSEDQTNWTDQNETSVTANAAANPLNSAVTADKVIPSATTDDHYRGLSMGSVVGEFSSSIYVKADGYSIIDYGVFNSTAANYPVRAVFDLSTETITQIDGSISSITSVGSGWYRISVSASVASTSTMGIYHRVRPSGTSGNYAGDGTSGMLLWGCQLESGVTTQYIGPTTSAAVSVGPVANLPRLDYSGGATCPKLLLEPQRTNVITNNNDFATGAANVTVLSNNATSPEGYQNADLITGDAGTLTKSVNFSGASAGAYTLSVFAKYNTQQWIQLAAGGIATYANFDIQNGVLGTTNGTSQIEDYGNGWYRCSVNLVSGTPLSFVVFLVTNGTSARFSTTTSTGSFWAYGIQSEIGAYPTSVIPTLGAALTRGADAASKTSATALIGQTEGTLFVEFVVDSSSSPTMAFFVSAAGVFDNAIWIQQNASDSVIFRVFSGTTEQCSITKTGLTNGQTVKIAGAYKANDFVLYVNGVQVGTDNSGTIPSSLSQLEIGSYAEVGSPYNQNRPVSQALLFKTRLSNADLAALTA
jgi:hypothetical protein